MLKSKITKSEFFQTARRAMIDCQIRPDGVVREDVIASFATLPREDYLPDQLGSVAYIDDDLSVGKGHFLLAPSVHARMVEALAPKKDDLVLDISISGGYSPAILASLVSMVVALEKDIKTEEKHAAIWGKHGIVNIAATNGGLDQGDERHAPFDLIFIHGAIPYVPKKIIAQLKTGGRMVCIIKKSGDHIGRATLVYKTTDDSYSTKILFEAPAPYLPGFFPVTEFVF